MAIVRRLEHFVLERDAQHSEAEATYSIVLDDDGRQILQIDTYGSRERQFLGKKSQSIRFTREAMAQLKQILDRM